MTEPQTILLGAGAVQRPSGDDPATAAPGIGAGIGSSDHGPLEPGSAFGARYHIIRLLGIGGMGAVYQAWDAELGVSVAIKVIRPEVMADPGAAAEVERRFKRELLLARQVTHKNVVRIHDLGEIGGIKYITMPYVDGADLATILRDEGRLPVPTVMRIARAVVSGLVEAHKAGVVHRDLKPANIMISVDDEAMIMDFGIARSTGGPPAQTAAAGIGMRSELRSASRYSDATMDGAVVGTVEYMAPEQAKGRPVDQRADIYAFGLILYDMLVGRRRAEHAVSAIAELQARLEEPPPPAKSLVPDLPDPLDRLVSRCLHPEPENRYQTTTELAAELDRLDDAGQPIPIKRVVGMRVVTALAALTLAMLGGTWWYARRGVVAPPKEAVSVLIADFDNQTNDSLFTGSLENTLGIAMEGASFITAYDRVVAQRLAVQLKIGTHLDESTARLLSRREGIKVILAGSIVNKGSGYAVSVKAVDPTADKVLTTQTASVSSKADALKAIGRLAGGIRGILGDTTSRTARLASADTFTSTSLEAVRSYSLAQDLAAAGKYEDALAHYQRATEQDPNFGRAYSGWATSAFRLGRRDEAAEHWKKAISFMDRMSEREKYRTLGTYYLGIARNYDQAIENYETLVRLYPADRIGHNNLAIAYFQKLNFQKALEEGRRAIEIYRGNVTTWNNSVLYAMYAGDFATAAKEAERVSKAYPDFPKAYLPQAMAALAGGRRDAAVSAYEQMAKAGVLGASLATMGRADLAVYEGRFADAETLLEAGIAEDRRTKNTEGLTSKSLALGEVYEATGRTKLSIDTSQAALKIGSGDAVVPAARILVRQGQESTAAKLAADLGQQLQPRNRAYAKIIEGEIALRQRRWVDAVGAFQSGLKLADVWLGHFDLGVAYVEAGHYAEGLAELDLCLKRRGEATAVFLDDIPSYRYLASVPYWLGRAKEELGMKPAAAEHYKAFLALRPNSPRDTLVVDARRRAGSS